MCVPSPDSERGITYAFGWGEELNRPTRSEDQAWRQLFTKSRLSKNARDHCVRGNECGERLILQMMQRLLSIWLRKQKELFAAVCVVVRLRWREKPWLRSLSIRRLRWSKTLNFAKILSSKGPENLQAHVWSMLNSGKDFARDECDFVWAVLKSLGCFPTTPDKIEGFLRPCWILDPLCTEEFFWSHCVYDEIDTWTHRDILSGACTLFSCATITNGIVFEVSELFENVPRGVHQIDLREDDVRIWPIENVLQRNLWRQRYCSIFIDAVSKKALHTRGLASELSLKLHRWKWNNVFLPSSFKYTDPCHLSGLALESFESGISFLRTWSVRVCLEGRCDSFKALHESKLSGSP